MSQHKRFNKYVQRGALKYRRIGIRVGIIDLDQMAKWDVALLCRLFKIPIDKYNEYASK